MHVTFLCPLSEKMGVYCFSHVCVSVGRTNGFRSITLLSFNLQSSYLVGYLARVSKITLIFFRSKVNMSRSFSAGIDQCLPINNSSIIQPTVLIFGRMLGHGE